MFIRMKQTANGSPDGNNVQTYEEGQAYDVPDRLGEIFVGAGLADEELSSQKDAGAAPKNKARTGTRRRKRG